MLAPSSWGASCPCRPLCSCCWHVKDACIGSCLQRQPDDGWACSSWHHQAVACPCVRQHAWLAAWGHLQATMGQLPVLCYSTRAAVRTARRQQSAVVASSCALCPCACSCPGCGGMVAVPLPGSYPRHQAVHGSRGRLCKFEVSVSQACAPWRSDQGRRDPSMRDEAEQACWQTLT